MRKTSPPRSANGRRLHSMRKISSTWGGREERGSLSRDHHHHHRLFLPLFLRFHGLIVAGLWAMGEEQEGRVWFLRREGEVPHSPHF